MVGFVRKKVKTYTLGEKLKRLREDADVSLAEIAKATKIRKVYLEKIESGQYDELPADVYIKGFLKGYATFLRIDVEEVLKQYEKERGVQNSIKKSKTPHNRLERFHLPMITITPKMFTATAFILLVLAGIFYFYREIGKFSQNPRLVLLQPSTDLSIDGSTIDVMGITDKDGKITINDQPVYVNEKGEFKETVSLQKGVNSLAIKALNRFGKESLKNYNISAQYEVQMANRDQNSDQEKVAGAATEQTPDKVRLEIRIENNPTWVSVEADGKNVQSGTMLAGAVQSFEADNQISVTSGKANQTFIKLNGQDIGALGQKPGLLRDVVFNKDTKIVPTPTVSDESQISNPDGQTNSDTSADTKKDKKKKKN